ncbi:MAG TPA: VOC family protein [Stellaceae bacterium]|nr:VOC family protein [Stellaceae bacterium]
MSIVAIDHVQLAMPKGGEERARKFYAGILGMTEEPKPPELAARGGAWFVAGTIHLHLGVEAEFRPARKAHPALVVQGLAAYVARARAGGCRIVDDDPLPGWERVFLDDPFGNRLELMEKLG